MYTEITMDVIRSCPDCKISGDYIDTCHRLEHIIALGKVAEIPTEKQSKKISFKHQQNLVVRALSRPEPSWALTSKTCDEIPEGKTEKVWVQPYLTSVKIHGHAHDCVWKVSRAGKDYCLVSPCHR